MQDKFESLRVAQMPLEPPLQEPMIVTHVKGYIPTDLVPDSLSPEVPVPTTTARAVIEVTPKVSRLETLKGKWEARTQKRSGETPGRMRRAIAAASVVLLLSGVAASSAQESDSSSSEYQEEPFEFSQDNVCPDGIFPDGKYEANRNAFADELNVRPESELTNTGEVIDYFFGTQPGPGVACRSAATEAVMIAGVNDLAGAGRLGGQGFATTDIADLQRRLAYNTDRAEDNAHILAELYAQGGMNTEPFTGAYYRAAQQEGVGGKPRVVFIQEHLDINEAGQVYVLSAADFAGDTFSGLDRDQMIVVDEQGNIYFRKAIGARVVEARNNADEEGASEQGPNNGGGGGSGNGAGEGPGHDGDRRGCDGTCGQGSHGGGGHGGGCGGSCGGGCGGGCGGHGGGHGGGSTTTTTRPSTTTTTSPPATTTTTRPPTTTTTSPPATTTTTRPPTTTTTPPPTHPPADGPPGGATQ